MKKHVALTLLALTTLGVLNAHVDLPEHDGRRFVLSEGRLHDPIGWAEDAWTRIWRNCGAVVEAPPSSDIALNALQVIRTFSPPDSQSARLLQLQVIDGWLLAELEFDTLSPAVVPLRIQDSAPAVLDQAIWSGSTEPWRPAPLIRRHIQTRSPQMPAALLDCLQPRGALFQPR